MTGAPVVNTWGAKGVLRWDDPHHAGTAGLQADDFDLAGLADSMCSSPAASIPTR